jgi:hypothetical protein
MKFLFRGPKTGGQTIVFVVVWASVAIAVIAAIASGDNSSASSSTPAVDNSAAPQADAPVSSVNGHWSRSLMDEPIDEAGLENYIQTGNVRCESYEDGTVRVYVTMTNNSAEHVTVNWYPRYSIVGGGIHGDGFSAAESNGFDSGETRDLVSEQHPKGVSGAVSINTCSPHFQMIESG